MVSQPLTQSGSSAPRGARASHDSPEAMIRWIVGAESLKLSPAPTKGKGMDRLTSWLAQSVLSLSPVMCETHSRLAASGS